MTFPPIMLFIVGKSQLYSPRESLKEEIARLSLYNDGSHVDEPWPSCKQP